MHGHGRCCAAAAGAATNCCVLPFLTITFGCLQAAAFLSQQPDLAFDIPERARQESWLLTTYLDEVCDFSPISCIVIPDSPLRVRCKSRGC